MRASLIAARLAIADDDHARWSQSIHAHLRSRIVDAGALRIAFCWPYQREFDARPLMLELLAQGATCALPIVVAPKRPLMFRQWHPDVSMRSDVYGIPIPVDSPEIVPDLLLLPLVGFDDQRFRLGYGAGYFDLTLGALGDGATSIGVGFEVGRLPTIYPQPHDVPLDLVVTELGSTEVS